MIIAFDNLDMVINSLDLGSGDREVELVKYTGYMPAHISGETGQLYYHIIKADKVNKISH